MKISKNNVAILEMQLLDSSGEELENFSGTELFPYLYESDDMPPAFHKQMENLSTGDMVEFNLSAEEAYGDYNPELIIELPKENLADVPDLQTGSEIVLTPQHPETGELLEEQARVFFVAEIHETTVIVDGNHPYAGLNLTFRVKVMDVREATDHEIEHGHAHLDQSEEDHD